MREFVEETRAQLTRWLLHLRREPFSLAFNLLNPLILLVFMGSAFQGLARNALGGDYRSYLLPGLLALTAFGNSMGGGIPLLFDRENGSLMIWHRCHSSTLPFPPTPSQVIGPGEQTS